MARNRAFYFLWTLCLFLTAAPSGVTQAQNFVPVTDTSNAVISDQTPNGYNGCAWIDYDNDGDQDLFVNPNTLYRNDGNGVFVHVPDEFLSVTGLGIGCSWADYNNDGFMDVLISGNPCTLYRNNGDGTFTAITEGDIGRNSQNDLRGWSPAWGDWDNDGNVDLIITHPAGFMGTPYLHNLVFHNDGPPNYTLSRVTNCDVTAMTAPYTVGTWSDFDNDGDLDYFIGAGPAGANPGPDYLFRNLLHESGAASLCLFTTTPMAMHLRDGQMYNWIDYDNDGDLDCFITNWGQNMGGGRANELYRHDDTTFTQITAGSIVTDHDPSLASVWGDFDNDGDLDCYVTNDGQTARYYQNNGDGTFTSQTNAATVSALLRGATAGDYDNDGDLDLFVNGNGMARKLFRNDLGNSYHWLELHCVGVSSNRAAIGAKVRVKASIGGIPTWQLREISAQNSFNSMNSLMQHFGLREAQMADSIRIDWPSGHSQYLTNVAADQILTVTEDNVSSVGGRNGALPTHSVLLDTYPNPFNPATKIRFTVAKPTHVKLELFDILGRRISELWNGRIETDKEITLNADNLHLSSGIFFVRATDAADNQTLASSKIIFMK